MKFRSVLELGAGQSSLLLDALRRTGHLEATIVTIEHDPVWARTVAAMVQHEVKTVPLREYQDEGSRRYRGYDFAGALPASNIDLLIIDGPPAWSEDQSFARHGCLQLLDCLDPTGFLIIVDDAERPGEVVLCERIERKVGKAASRGHTIASKRQVIFASGSLRKAAFF
jgi:hypothetical protein